MTKHLSFTLAFGVVLGTMGLVQPVLAHEDGACKADAQKFCGDVKPGGGAIKDCMKSHEADLSQGCKDNMAEGKEKMKEKMEAMKAACQADIKQFCASVTPGEGREIACLKSYDDKISAGCKAALPKHGMHRGMRHHGDMKPGDKPESSAEGQDAGQ